MGVTIGVMVGVTKCVTVAPTKHSRSFLSAIQNAQDIFQAALTSILQKQYTKHATPPTPWNNHMETHRNRQTTHGTESLQNIPEHSISSSRRLLHISHHIRGMVSLSSLKHSQSQRTSLTHHKSTSKHVMQTLGQIVRRGGRIIPCVYSLFAVLMSCFFGVWAIYFFAMVAPHF